jgi:hypothetical protein
MNTRPLLSAVSGLVLATGLFAQAPQLEFPAASPAATFKQRVGITDISDSTSAGVSHAGGDSVDSEEQRPVGL